MDVLGQMVADNGKAIQKSVNKAVGQANDQAQGIKAMGQAFGNQAGTGTANPAGGLSADEKKKLAGLFKKHGRAFKKFADLLGRFMTASTTAEMSKSRGKTGTIVDITIGDDIASALDEDVLEVLSDDPDFAALGMLKVAESSLMEYECEEDEPQHRVM